MPCVLFFGAVPLLLLSVFCRARQQMCPLQLGMLCCVICCSTVVADIPLTSYTGSCAGNGSSEHIGDEVQLPAAIPLNDGLYEVGRASPADIQINIPTVSSRHALLRVGKHRPVFPPVQHLSFPGPWHILV